MLFKEIVDARTDGRTDARTDDGRRTPDIEGSQKKLQDMLTMKEKKIVKMRCNAKKTDHNR